MRPGESRAGLLRILRLQWRAVAAALPLKAGNAARDCRPAGNQRRTRVGLGCIERGGNGLDIVSINRLNLPPGRAKPRRHVLADRKGGIAIIGNVVVVPQEGQLAESQMTGQRNRFLSDPFLQAAVAHKGPGPVIDEVVAETRRQPCFRDRHADRTGNSLTEKARRDLDTRVLLDLGMAGTDRAELAEALQRVDGHLFVAGKMQQRVKQHRSMTVGEHDAVAVRPERGGRIDLQMPRIERRGNFRHAKRHALMTFAGIQD